MKLKILSFILIFPFLVSCGLSESRIKREKNAVGHYKLGIAHLMGETPALQKAYIQFQKAVRLDPRHRNARYFLGHIYFQQEKYDEAINSFQKVISIDSDYSEAHNYLGRIYSLQEKFDLAIASYQTALKNLEYETPETSYWNLGLVYVRQEKYEDATRELKNALLVNPNFIRVHNLLGSVYTKMGAKDKSIASYKRVLQIAPKDLNAHYNLACIYQKEGSTILAKKGFERVIELSPELADEPDLKKCMNRIEPK